MCKLITNASYSTTLRRKSFYIVRLETHNTNTNVKTPRQSYVWPNVDL